MDDSWEIRRYDKSGKTEWDAFVRCSRNGTFLFLRDYMDYHADRFHDSSLMAYHGGRLCALLPAHCEGKLFCSHRGLTYGGIVTDERMTARLMLELFEEVIRFIRQKFHFPLQKKSFTVPIRTGLLSQAGNSRKTKNPPGFRFRNREDSKNKKERTFPHHP